MPSRLLVILGVISVPIALLWERSHTPRAPLAELIPIQLGDQLHYATIRSQIDRWHDDDSPILLSLHGGPGASEIPFLHSTDGILEKHFIVVHYDQRSAGKSCKFHDDGEELTIEQHVNDAMHMALYLRERFQKDKIYLMGGSWGSVLALLLARDYPHLFHHVAVRGIVVKMAESEVLSNHFISTKFPNDFVPYPLPYGDRIEDMADQRSWLYRAGGMIHQRCSEGKCSKYDLTLRFLKAVLTSPEYSWADVVRFKKCYMSTLKRLWPMVEKFDAVKQVPKLDVPLLVLHGRHDHCTDQKLVEPYFNALIAPSKRLVWFEDSAHSPMAEEPVKFASALIQEFLHKKI